MTSRRGRKGTRELPGVESEPDISLTDWSIIRISAAGQHWDVLLGWCVRNICGRVSTPIEQYFADNRVAVTRSGRSYSLVGPPGRNPEAIHIYAKMFGHIPHERADVTQEYIDKT